MQLKLKNGNVKEVASGITAMEAAKAISEGLARAAVAVRIDGQLKDLSAVLDRDCVFEVLTFKDEQGKEIYRHTASHVLAQAIKTVYPTSKLAIGPAVKTGFYYDVDFRNAITMDDLAKIESEMVKIIKADFPIERIELSRRKVQG